MASSPRTPISQQCAADADQVELNALRSGRATITTGADDERLAGVLDDSVVEVPLGGSEPWQLGDLVGDDSVGPIHEELSRRAHGLQGAYPFELEDSALVHDSERCARVYEFLLAASFSTHEGNRHVQLPRLFERVATRLIESYFGKNAKSRHFGWPRDGDATFEDAARALHTHTGEWHWGPEEGLDPTHVKDEGCDFVVWLDSSDGRKTGQLFILGQCACGNNWQDKWRDLKVETLQRWFNPLSLVDPVRSFATPRHVADELLREASREAGIVFDRSRLVLAAANQDVFDDETSTAMERLTKLVCDG